jgi:DNA-binding HxlR family transcriptional regulator
LFIPELPVTNSSYNQFCPVAMAAEILCSRWTLVLVRELLAGSTRFNELRRGVPRMSPTLLSKRLKDLEAAGIVELRPVKGEPDVFEYRLTKAGWDLQGVVEAFGVWGQQWIETTASLENLDPNLLMWDMRRNIDPKPMPRHRSTIQVIFSDLPQARRNWWLIVQPAQDVDLCSVDPGFDVDLYISTDLRTMTEVWMGHITIARAEEAGRLRLSGSAQLRSNLTTWLRLSPFARFENTNSTGMRL